MDKHTTILAIPEINEITIKEACNIFRVYKDKNIISNSNFEDDLWYLNNEMRGVTFDFSINEEDYKFFKKKFKLSSNDFKKYLKTYVTCQLGQLALVSLQGIVRITKQIAYNDANNLDDIIKINSGTWIGRVSEFFSMIPENERENELTDLLIKFDNAEESYRSGQFGERRFLASFESYFRFDEILKRFWSESKNEYEKLFYFPIWMWWNISGILPLRPCEFIVTPRNCLNKINENYTLSVRRNKLKGSEKRKTYKIDMDYEINRYVIPDKLAHEIEWYIEKTKDLPESNTHTLFVTGVHYAMWERITPYTSRSFSYVNLRTCLRYFYKHIIEDRYAYKVIYENCSDELEDEKTIEYLQLGDTRHIALINMIAEGTTPVVAMILAGHDNPDMSSHYYSNITQLIECRTYRQYKKYINGKQCYSLSKNVEKLSVKDCVNLENGGRCTSKKIVTGDYSDCYKVMGPGGEIGFCKNCRFYLDDKKSFSDNKDIYLNRIQRECDLLEGIIRKVRTGNGEPEEIISVILRLRDNAFSYQQYLLEKMEEEHAKNENL